MECVNGCCQQRSDGNTRALVWDRHRWGRSTLRNEPSKILTAVGKSLTLRAALRAAAKTPTDGTRSYAKALLRFRCDNIVNVSTRRHIGGVCQGQAREESNAVNTNCHWGGREGKERALRTHLELEDILYTVEFLLVSVIDGISRVRCLLQNRSVPFNSSCLPRREFLERFLLMTSTGPFWRSAEAGGSP